MDQRLDNGGYAVWSNMARDRFERSSAQLENVAVGAPKLGLVRPQPELPGEQELPNADTRFERARDLAESLDQERAIAAAP